MNILIDMNLSSDWIGPLQAAGYRAIHWSELGAPAAPDDEIAAHARDNGFVLFTNDLEQGAILTIGKSGIRVRRLPFGSGEDD